MVPALEEHEEHVLERTVPVDVLGHLGQHRGGADDVGHGVHDGGQRGDAEHERPQDQAHDHERDAGVAGLGGPEDAHPVGDGLGAGQRRAPRGERLHDDEHRRPEEQAVSGRADGDGPRLVQRMGVEVTEDAFTEPTTMSSAMLAMKK